jgi:hypothetical protein
VLVTHDEALAGRADHVVAATAVSAARHEARVAVRMAWRRPAPRSRELFGCAPSASRAGRSALRDQPRSNLAARRARSPGATSSCVRRSRSIRRRAGHSMSSRAAVPSRPPFAKWWRWRARRLAGPRFWWS